MSTEEIPNEELHGDEEEIEESPDEYETGGEHEDEAAPRVGLGLLVVRQTLDGPDQVLLGRRRGSHWAGHHQGPGGKLASGESLESGVLRELREEAGDEIVVRQVEYLCTTNIANQKPHYLDIGFQAVYVEGRPIVMEPDKNDFWRWFPLTPEGLPRPLMPGLQNYIAAYVLRRKLGIHLSHFEGSGIVRS